MLDFVAFFRTQFPSKTDTLEKFAKNNERIDRFDVTKCHIRQIRWPLFDKGPRGLSYSPKKSSGCHSRRGEGTIRNIRNPSVCDLGKLGTYTDAVIDEGENC